MSPCTLPPAWRAHAARNLPRYTSDPTAVAFEPGLDPARARDLLATLGAGLPALSHSQMWHLAVSAAILGAGVGISLTAAMNTVVRAVHPDRAASTFAAVMLIRTFGGMLGSQVCMTVLTIGLRGGASGSASSRFTDAFALAAGGCALALIAGWRFPRGSMARAGEVPGATSVGEKAAVGRAPTSS